MYAPTKRFSWNGRCAPMKIDHRPSPPVILGDPLSNCGSIRQPCPDLPTPCGELSFSDDRFDVIPTQPDPLDWIDKIDTNAPLFPNVPTVAPAPGVTIPETTSTPLPGAPTGGPVTFEPGGGLVPLDDGGAPVLDIIVPDFQSQIDRINRKLDQRRRRHTRLKQRRGNLRRRIARATRTLRSRERALPESRDKAKLRRQIAASKKLIARLKSTQTKVLSQIAKIKSEIAKLKSQRAEIAQQRDAHGLTGYGEGFLGACGLGDMGACSCEGGCGLGFFPLSLIGGVGAAAASKVAEKAIGPSFGEWLGKSVLAPIGIGVEQFTASGMPLLAQGLLSKFGLLPSATQQFFAQNGVTPQSLQDSKRSLENQRKMNAALKVALQRAKRIAEIEKGAAKAKASAAVTSSKATQRTLLIGGGIAAAVLLLAMRRRRR